MAHHVAGERERDPLPVLSVLEGFPVLLGGEEDVLPKRHDHLQRIAAGRLTGAEVLSLPDPVDAPSIFLLISGWVPESLLGTL